VTEVDEPGDVVHERDRVRVDVLVGNALGVEGFERVPEPVENRGVQALRRELGHRPDRSRQHQQRISPLCRTRGHDAKRGDTRAGGEDRH
jgi:hypothetical protein